LKRFDELVEVIASLDENARKILEPTIERIVFLEQRLDALEKLPFIKVHPEDQTKQKPTVAGKQYKDLLQQHNNCIKILLSAARKENGEEESPLRQWGKKQLETRG
jgi:hypothetical protein